MKTSWKCSCISPSITEVFISLQLDGLLFYHKQGHYFFGPTPLVLWLKPYMVPEIIGSDVSADHMSKKPSDYVSFSVHVDKVIAEKEHREKERLLAQRGVHCHGRRGRGRGYRRLTTEPFNQSQGMEVSSPLSETVPPLPRNRSDNYRHAGKGRGRGRGQGRGQNSSREEYEGQCQFDSGEMKEYVEENSLEECMEGVSSSRRRGRHRRNNRNNRNEFEAMDAAESGIGHQS